MNCIQRVLRTNTIEIGNQIDQREVLLCAIQELKYQFCFMYFEICNTTNFDKYDYKKNII